MLWAALALASDAPHTFEHGGTEVQAGSALYQTAGYGRGIRDFGSVNVNVEMRRQLFRGVLIGIQGAGHWLTYDRHRVWALTLRAEPKLGFRVRLTRTTQLDSLIGVAIDGGSGGFRAGPVLSVGLRQWLGRSPVFVSIEPRLAPIAWGSSTQMLCHSYCNQTHVYNPGGTGVLVAVGASFRSRSVSEIE